MILQLFTKTISVFKKIETGEYIFSSGIIFLLVIFNSCYSLLEVNDTYTSLLYGIPLVGLEFVFLYYISPFILMKFSKLMGGVATNSEMRIVLATCLIPEIPGYAFVILNDFHSDSFLASAAFLEGFGSLFKLKVLILGLAYYNKFSVKHSMMTLITLWACLMILVFLIT